MANNEFGYSKINAYHMTDDPKLYDPARSNMFEFHVDIDGSWLKAGVNYSDSPAEADLIGNIGEKIRLSVTKASVPHFKQNVVEVQRGNTRAKFAGAIEFDAGSLVINDFVGLNTKAALMAWRRLVGDVSTGAVGRKQNYAKTCHLVEYTPDYLPIREWELKGCWISEISEDDFDYDNDGKRQINVTIQYDRAIPKDLYNPDAESKMTYNKL